MLQGGAGELTREHRKCYLSRALSKPRVVAPPCFYLLLKQKTVTTYHNHDSKEKIISRRKIYKQVLRNVKFRRKLGTVNVLTLPSTNFALENELVKLEGVALTCVEKERDIFLSVYEKSCTKAYYLGDVFDYLSISYTPFDVLWLDLCAPLSFKILNRFLSLVQSDNIAKGATLALTVMAQREQESELLSKSYNCSTVEEFRTVAFPKLVTEFAAMAGKKCTLKETYKYKSTIPMIMYTFIFK